MLKSFAVAATSIAYFLCIPNIANAEVKKRDCNTIKVENNGANVEINCNPSEAEIKIFHRMVKEAYTAKNKEGDGTSSIRIKKLNLPESNNSEYHYISFWEARNIKVVKSTTSSNGYRHATIEVSAIERIYKRTRTYDKPGENYYRYELKTEFDNKGGGLLYFDSINKTWKFSGGFGHR